MTMSALGHKQPFAIISGDWLLSGQTSHSRGRFSELESECLLYSKAVIQIVGNQDI